MRLPETWAQVTVGRVVVDMQPGFAQSPGDEDDGSTPQIRTHNVTPSGKISLAGIKHVRASTDERDRYSLRPGDILFNNTNSEEWVGKTAVFDQKVDFVFSNHMTRLRVDQRVVDPVFLARYLHFLWSIGFSRTRAKRWVSQAGIEGAVLARFQLPLPTLPEQRRIVDVLRQAELVGALAESAAGKLADLGNARFYEMFGHLAENPYEFEIEKFAEFGSLDRGVSKHRPRDAPHLFGGPYPFIQTGDVANAGDRICSYTATYSEAGLAQSKLWPKGTLCITIAANIARAAILEFDACFPDSVVGFTPNDDVTSEYVLYCLRFYQEYFESRAPKSAQMNINLETLRKLRIPRPPGFLQQEFGAFVQELRAIHSWVGRQEENRKNLSAVLTADAFTGALTESWRDEHGAEIKVAAKERDALLGGEGAKRSRTADAPVTSPPVPITRGRPRRHWLHGQLSDFQRRVMDGFLAYSAKTGKPLLTEDPDAFAPFCEGECLTKSLADFEQVSPNRIGRTLSQLAELGLIAKVTLVKPNEVTGEEDYLKAFRPLRETEYRRTADLEQLGGADAQGAVAIGGAEDEAGH